MLDRLWAHGRGSAWKPVAVLVIVILLGFLNGLDAPFIFDDWARIADQPNIRAARLAVGGSSRPLVDLSFHLNYRLSGLIPADFRLVNVVLHLAASLLLYDLLLQAIAARSRLSPVRARVCAVFIAALWSVHPLQTESVTYVVQRAEVLAGLAMLATLDLFAHGCRARTRAAWWMMGSVASCAVGMACKPVMVVAPFLVLAYDGALGAGSIRSAWRVRWRFYLALAATWLVPALLLSMPTESTASVGPERAGLGVGAYLVSEAEVVLYYLRLGFWPTPLCLDYAWLPETSAIRAAPALVAVAGMILFSVHWYRLRGILGYLGISFFLLLAPSSSIFPIADLAAEHRMYLPLAPLITAVVFGVNQLLTKLEFLCPARTVWLRRVTCILGFVAVTGLVVLTRERNREYRDPLRLWNRVVQLRPHNYRAKVMVVEELLRAQRWGAAESRSVTLINEIVRITQAEGTLVREDDRQTRAAVPAYYYHIAYDQLGRALWGQGRLDEAIRAVDQALVAKPDFKGGRQHRFELERERELRAAVGTGMIHRSP